MEISHTFSSHSADCSIVRLSVFFARVFSTHCSIKSTGSCVLRLVSLYHVPARTRPASRCRVESDNWIVIFAKSVFRHSKGQDGRSFVGVMEELVRIDSSAWRLIH
jgi:hypothetical protein